MDVLNYYDLENIISKCVSGEIYMHDPIEVTNKLKNQRTEMSILKHLLILCQSDKKSLIHILSLLRYQIKQNLLELINDNTFIRHYIQNVIQEWTLDISPVDLLSDGLDQCGFNEGEDIFLYDEYINEKKCSQEGGNKLKVLENALKERQQSHTPMTREYAEHIQDKFKNIYTECNDCRERVKQHTADTMTKHKMIDPKHIDILLDLSCKSKASYLEYSNRIKEEQSLVFSTFINETHDLDIPDNIHIIFLNYLISLNMIKKELNYITNSFKGILSEMQPKMLVLDNIMNDTNEWTNMITEEPLAEGEPLAGEEKEGGLSILGFSFF
jgi:hypothetical protein